MGVCEQEGCLKRASFDIVGGKGAWCVTHKTAVMVDVISKRCAHPGCDSRPNFDIVGGKGAWCVTHKTAVMVDVKHKRCAHPGCDSHPLFDIVGGKGAWCVTHKTALMVDVKHKRCAHPGCDARAFVGIPGRPPTHCASHRTPGMLRRPNARCAGAKCRELALYGINQTPRHCEAHKTDEDLNLVERPCASCGLMYVLDSVDKCENCAPESFRTARLAKQNALMAALDARGLTGFSTDRTIDGGTCGLERPDRVFDLGDRIVILECDEHQHEDRPCACEQTRMVNISQSFGGLPVLFIRWNPDAYDPANARKKQVDVRERQKVVGDLLEDIVAGRIRGPVALVSVMYMYFDEWESVAQAIEEWQVLIPFEAGAMIDG